MFDVNSSQSPVIARYGQMFIPEGDTVIGRSLSVYGEWAQHEIDILSTFHAGAGIILDVGANIGTHSLAFASKFPWSTVVAFEPQPVPFQMLSANALFNGYRNVRALNIACGRQRKLLGASVDYAKLGQNTGAFSLHGAVASRRRTTKRAPIAVVPIDYLCFDARIDLIKIDVEGMEADVIAGAARTISQHRPVLFMETLSLDAARQCIDALAAFDYRLYWLETWPYNAGNFNGISYNIWARCEIGILALPQEHGHVVGYPPVTGNEHVLPSNLDPSRGYDSVAARRTADGGAP